MRKLLFRHKKVVEQINRMMWEEHAENQFEESQVMRSYSAGIIDGLGMALSAVSPAPEEARSFPLSLSFYEEDEDSCTINARQQQVEAMRERVFDLQQENKLSLFYEEVD